MNNRAIVKTSMHHPPSRRDHELKSKGGERVMEVARVKEEESQGRRCKTQFGKENPNVNLISSKNIPMDISINE